jgi:hypothetical protein
MTRVDKKKMEETKTPTPFSVEIKPEQIQQPHVLITHFDEGGSIKSADVLPVAQSRPFGEFQTVAQIVEAHGAEMALALRDGGRLQLAPGGEVIVWEKGSPTVAETQEPVKSQESS